MEYNLQIQKLKNTGKTQDSTKQLHPVKRFLTKFKVNHGRLRKKNAEGKKNKKKKITELVIKQ